MRTSIVEALRKTILRKLFGNSGITDKNSGRAQAFVGVPRLIAREKSLIVKICILASSSAGNSTFIGTDKTRLLIDAGLSRREVVKRLAGIGEDLACLDAVL